LLITVLLISSYKKLWDKLALLAFAKVSQTFYDSVSPHTPKMRQSVPKISSLLHPKNAPKCPKVLFRYKSLYTSTLFKSPFLWPIVELVDVQILSVKNLQPTFTKRV
ncbi:MAG TPA: hypothetical protein PLY95_03730, partial [Candidatus Paceibacterota bacterium]|nr:hypothetical protein [Candidatus Paceibacterota bacterium]